MPLFIDESDSRYEEFKAHEQEHGYSPDELWNLDVAFASYMVPRLKGYRRNTEGHHPGDCTHDEWLEILDKIIWALEHMIIDDYYSLSKEDSAKVDEGIDLFAKYIRSMWI